MRAQDLGQAQRIPGERGPVTPRSTLPARASVPSCLGSSGSRWAGSRQLTDSSWLKRCGHLGVEGTARGVAGGPGHLALMLGSLPPGSPALLALASATGLWMQRLASGPCCALYMSPPVSLSAICLSPARHGFW